MTEVFVRPFLKWPGRKYNVLTTLDKYFTQFAHCTGLAEPFMGSGTIFLNTNFKNYYLADCNQDLINLYLYLVNDGEKFIKLCSKYFRAENNSQQQYYDLRDQFNDLDTSAQKAALFLYLNRHGYNGLCRYNNKGGYNVPFGRYTTVNLPLDGLLSF